MSDNKFQGWGAFGKDSIEGNMKWFDYEPKPFDDDDIESTFTVVDIADTVNILYCGICGSDIHTAGSGWGDMSALYPMVVGHEIVGTVTKAGPNQKYKEGDLVGIGAQCDSCMECRYCKESE
jgi:alcohol dehydrogenase (NADP+)